jgi:hypothetical protein
VFDVGTGKIVTQQDLQSLVSLAVSCAPLQVWYDPLHIIGSVFFNDMIVISTKHCFLHEKTRICWQIDSSNVEAVDIQIPSKVRKAHQVEAVKEYVHFS